MSSHSKHNELRNALLSMVFGSCFGLCLKLLPIDEYASSFLDMVFVPFRTIFINALHMIIGPIVFLAIVCCISEFKSISEIGKIGVKLLGMYVFTTVLAVCIGFLLFNIFPIGNESIASELSNTIGQTLSSGEEAQEILEATDIATSSDPSIKNIIIGIVPNNIFTPFAQNNLLQILFLAVFIGMGVNVVSSNYPVLNTVFNGLKEVFTFLMGILCRFIPLAIFCNMTCLVYDTGLAVLRSIMGLMALAIGGIACMMVIYLIIIMLALRVSPIPFIKKFGRTAITALTLSSSTAVMPLSIESCEKMGVSSRIASFAVPLGSTINMDGSSLVMSIICLYMAKVFGVEITPALMISILVSIVLLSLGAPTMAGADLAIIAILISQIGVPVYAIALIMGIDTILDMCQAMSNTTGDAVTAMVVAKMDNAFDVKKYYEN